MSLADELYRAMYGQEPTVPKPIKWSGFLPPAKAQPKPGFVRIAKPQPRPFVRIAKPKVFVSFDYENDRLYKQALDMWDANKRFDFSFKSNTPQEIQSESVERVKAVLTTKVKASSHVVVLVGKYANELHSDSQKIGFRNWINFEVYQARYYKKKVVVVMLSPYNTLPEWLRGSGATLVNSFNEKEIIQALSK